MSPLAGFLIFIVSITALVIAYLTKQFQEENIIYSNNSQIKKNLNTKTVEKEKVVVETLNGKIGNDRFDRSSRSLLDNWSNFSWSRLRTNLVIKS